MGVKEQFQGKLQAARAFAECVRHFRNWREVWSAYRTVRPLPPFELRNGLTLHHGPGDPAIFLYREIFVDRCYAEADFYRPRPSDTVVDLGANIGVFALFLQSEARGIRVHCFEPASATRATLLRNVEANGLAEAVRVHPQAISDRAGVVELKHADISGRQSLFDNENESADGVTESVECLGLDEALDLCGVEKVDLLKIDIEGAEIEVVEGASARSWEKVARVVAEYHDAIRPGSRERVTKALEAAGFGEVRAEFPPPANGFGIIRASRR